MSAISPLAFSLSWTNADKLSLFWELYRASKKAKAKKVEEYYESYLDFHCTDQLSEITHPVHLLYGEKDKLFRDYGTLMNQKLPNSELIFIPNAIHQIPTKAKRTLNTLIKEFVETYKHLEEITGFFLEQDIDR